MYLLDIVPVAKIPHTQPQILSYFFGTKLPKGALIQIPLGRRKETGVVIASRNVADYKMEIKNATFELRNAEKIISSDSALTDQQIELMLFLGMYYFCSPGIFAKTMLAGQPTRQNINKNETPAPRQTLILVPSISQVYSSGETRSADSVVWHSELTRKEKNTVWLAVKNGQTQTIIGTRSAVFLPFVNLKKIIVKDKLSPNHKSWDMFPHYDSRLIARKLAKIFQAKLAYSDRFTAINSNRIKPTIIDMRQELKGGNFSIFSVDLYEAVKSALAAKKQIILFINRRGTANFILCRDCGYIAKCQNCDAPLAHHLINNKPSLFCHHCGAKDTPPSLCPKCKSWRIKTVGSGTQKVEAETQKFFPDAKILRLDSDAAPKAKDQQKIIADFTGHKAEVLIATQIIFSWLDDLAAARPAVIGILSADTLLHIPDFRSGERTWQTIMALQNLTTPSFIKKGRGGLKSLSAPLYKGGTNRTLFIQTYNPDNSVLKYIKNNDYTGFIKDDTSTREILDYPPFSQIVKLTFRHRDAKKAAREAKTLQAKLQRLNKNERIKINAAMPSFIPRKKGKYIWSIIIKTLPALLDRSPRKTTARDEQEKTEQIFTMPNFLKYRNFLLQYVPQNWEIDVDPENLL